MARKSTTCRVQVYLTDPKIAAGLNREARSGRIPVSQAAGQAIARGLRQRPQADPEDLIARCLGPRFGVHGSRRDDMMVPLRQQGERETHGDSKREAGHRRRPHRSQAGRSASNSEGLHQCSFEWVRRKASDAT